MRSFILSLFILLLCGTSFAQLADDSTINPISGEIDKITPISTIQSVTGWTRNSTDSTVYLTNSGDSVGIGTSEPEGKLDVVGGANTYVNIDSIPEGEGGCDANTLLLMHMDGSEGGITFTDDNCAGSANTATAHSTAITSQATKIFGTASLDTGATGEVRVGTVATFKNMHNFDAYPTWTWDLWYKATAFSARNYFFSTFGTGVSSGQGIGIWINTDRSMQILVLRGGSSTYAINYTTPAAVYPNDTDWHRIFVTYDHSLGSNNVKFYVDGSLVGQGNKTGLSTGTGNQSGVLEIGNAVLAGTSLDKNIDEFRISNVVRSEASLPTNPYDSDVVANPILNFKTSGVLASRIRIDGSDSNKFKIDVPSTTRMTIDANGNTGLGVTSPMNKLDVYGGAVIGTSYAGSMLAPTNGVLITGNVGVGTAITRAKLDVEGNAYIKGNVGVGTITPKSTIDINGSVGFSIVSTDVNLTLTNTHNTVMVTDTATITLPTAVGITGRQYNVINSGTGTVTIATTGGQTIRGEASLEMYDQGSVVLISNGANWERGS